MMLLCKTGECIALAATGTETGSIGDDRENLEEQSCRGFTVGMNCVFVQQSPAGCLGKCNSPRRVKIQTGCKSDSLELMKYAFYVVVATSLAFLQFGTLY